MKVNNLPANYTDYKFITVINVNDEWWFYGAFLTDLDRAIQQAVEIHGQVMGSDMIHP